MRKRSLRMLLGGLAAAGAGHAPSLLACAACYGGRSDSPLAAGMNWGIFSLLGVIGFVLSGFAAFGVFLVKKSAAVAATPTTAPATAPDPTNQA